MQFRSSSGRPLYPNQISSTAPPGHIGLWYFKMNWYTQQNILEVHILHPWAEEIPEGD